MRSKATYTILTIVFSSVFLLVAVVLGAYYFKKVRKDQT
jgi:preprotein translocase subunit SecG